MFLTMQHSYFNHGKFKKAFLDECKLRY
uniref:Uncharacterized protein n=1 Tax=Anguilla anguilla TaxID=7936 RepID=A0A0E9U275_ANGAN